MIKTKNKSAFTIVEIIIVVTVIAVLSSLAVVTYSSTRQDARDAARYGNVTIISEALEKYYEENGEYPSVASIVNDTSGNTGAVVAEKLSIPVDSLAMPEMPGTATNSLTSGPELSNDYIVYLGQSMLDNDRCQYDVNGGCDQYVLRYQEESGDTQVIESRRASRETIQKPDISVAASGPTQINASWTSISDATSYTLQRSVSADMGSPVSSSHATTSTSATGLATNTTYYFRVQANLPSGTSDWSEVQSATTNGITAPTGTLTIVAAMSGSNAVGTAGGGTCATGTTIERQIRYHATNTSTAGGWSTYTTGVSRSVAASQGWRYTFQQQARCVSGSATTGWIQSGTASVDMPISTPAAPGLYASTSGNTTTWTASSSCPTGTTASYERSSLQEGGAWTGWGGLTTSNTSSWYTAAQGYTYYRVYHVRCGNAIINSAWSPQSAIVSYTRPIIVPQPTGWTHVSLGWQHESNCMYYSTGCKWRRYNWTPPTCPSGTSYYSSRWNSYVGPGMSWDNGQGDAYRWWYGWSTTSSTNDSVAYSSLQNSHIIEYRSNVPYNYDDVKHKVIYTCRNSVTGRTGTIEAHSPTFRYM